VAEGTVLGTDPRLARLRRLSGQARAMRVDFAVAWSAGRRAVLADLRA
jgi:hypothetical protein